MALSVRVAVNARVSIDLHKTLKMEGVGIDLAIGADGFLNMNCPMLSATKFLDEILGREYTDSLLAGVAGMYQKYRPEKYFSQRKKIENEFHKNKKRILGTANRKIKDRNLSLYGYYTEVMSFIAGGMMTDTGHLCGIVGGRPSLFAAVEGIKAKIYLGNQTPKFWYNNNHYGGFPSPRVK